MRALPIEKYGNSFMNITFLSYYFLYEWCLWYIIFH